MRIDELFDKPAPVEWDWKTGAYGGTAKFETGGKRFAAKWGLSEKNTCLDFAFYNESVDPTRATKITGTGDQHAVISTVIDIVKTLMAKYPINEITFVADEPNRQRLYTRVMKTVFPDWKGEEEFPGAFRYTKPRINVREVFDKPVPIEWDWDYDWANEMRASRAEFVIDGRLYQAYWELTEKSTRMLFEFADISTEANMHKITGVGNQHAVFATVVEILRTIMNSYPIEVIDFAADEPSRQKLYMHLIRRYLPGWKVSEKNLNGMRVYTVTKPV
jgi:hypothetical protein